MGAVKSRIGALTLPPNLRKGEIDPRRWRLVDVGA